MFQAIVECCGLASIIFLSGVGLFIFLVFLALRLFNKTKQEVVLPKGN